MAVRPLHHVVDPHGSLYVAGRLDGWSDALDGAPILYRPVESLYLRGELSEAEWLAYRAGYANERDRLGKRHERDRAQAVRTPFGLYAVG